MSLPDDVASTQKITASFMRPDTRRVDKLVDWERGGLAVNDASAGLDVQNWQLTYDQVNVILTPEIGSPTVLFSLVGITELALAFDQNMRPAVAYILAGVLKLRWYDGTIPGYNVIDFGITAKNPKLTLDDKRPANIANSDIILAYIKDQALYYRQQRDRFTVARLLQGSLAPQETLHNIGMSRGLRLQFEMG